jgi:hypothetical protein
MDIISSLKDEGKMAITASHAPLVYSAPMVDRLIASRDGMIKGDGT